jgi:hypothetical protein
MSQDKMLFQRSLSVLLVLLLLASSFTTVGVHAGTAEESGTEDLETETVSPSLPPFGVQMYGGSGKTSAYFPALIESGASWVRIPFSWSSVEREFHEPAKYSWWGPDRAVAAAIDGKAHGRDINIVLTLDHAPEWAATHGQGPIDKVDISVMARLMNAVAQRYNGDGVDDAPGSPVVNYFEFYNEPDRFCGGAFAWGADGDQYAEMLKAVYPAIKAANPQAKIVFGGIAYDYFSNVDKQTRQCNTTGLEEWPIRGGSFTRSFLDDVLTACGADDCFDIMNYHFYAEFAPNWARHGENSLSVGLYEKTNYIRNKLAEYGMGDKPIMVTEAGKHTNGVDDPTATPAMQARFLVVFFTQAAAANLHMLTWWLLYDLPLDLYPMHTGIVTEDGTKKPAFDSYTTVVSLFTTFNYERPLTEAETGVSVAANPNMEAYKFFDPVSGRNLYVAWLNVIWTEETRPLTVPGEKMLVLDVYGKAKQIVTDADDGTVDGMLTVQVSGEPVFIVDPIYAFIPVLSK